MTPFAASTARVFILAILTFLPAAAQDAAARDARWRADLDSLAARIGTAHPNPYTRVSADSFRQQVAELRERIPSLSDRQMVLGMARILALLNDSHSTMNLFQAGTAIRRYPVTYRWFSDGLFVTGAPETRSRAVGAKVLAIAGKPVEEVYEAIRPWVSHDAESWYRYSSQAALAIHDMLVAANVVPDGAPLVLDLEAAAGQQFREEIPLAAAVVAEGPVFSRPALPLYRRLANQDYWFDWLPAERTLYIQYNRCRESALLPIRRFAADIIAFARDNRPERWVIDIRENSGGASQWFQLLLNEIGLAVAGGQVPFPAKGGFGITGKRTFSSGTLAAWDMRGFGMQLVGETTGGRVFWFGENLPHTLPSGLQVAISTRFIGRAPEPEMAPDVAVEFRSADFFADRDPYLDKVLTLESEIRAASRPLPRVRE